MQDAPVEEVVVGRVAAIDVGKAEVVCSLRRVRVDAAQGVVTQFLHLLQLGRFNNR